MTAPISRHTFLRQSAGWLYTLAAVPWPSLVKTWPRLSFSTLGCPDWDFIRIMDFASAHHFQALELRGIQRQLDLTKSEAFKDTAARQKSMQALSERGLKIINLGSSATLHFPPGAERSKQLDEGRAYVDLAHQLSCPYVRVFPNNYPKDQDKKYTRDLIITGLQELCTHARGSGVQVLLETHGDLVYSSDLLEIMKAVPDSGAGLIWDICNMWTITREHPAEVYKLLGKYVRHCHIKDARWTEGKLIYRFLGQGEVPVFDAIDVLVKGRYKGYFSFEWEKLWHPEIAEPEEAFANYANTMQQYFSKK